MERDLRRMSRCGLTGVILCLDGSVVNDEFRSGRVKRFVQLAGKPAFGGMQVGIMLESVESPGTALTHRRLASWISGMQLESLPALWQPTGRPAVIAGRGLDVSGRPHPAVLVIDGETWRTGGPRSSSRPVPSPRFGQVLIHAGWHGAGARSSTADQEGWQKPRQDGETLRTQLWQAFAARGRLICISSWNDFQHGDFVEPNNLDGEAVYEVLREEIARVRRACSRQVAELQQE